MNHVIAILSDIHGNAPALQSVIADATSRGVVTFLNAGDTVGEAPFPNETIELLIKHHFISIRGNFDRNCYDFERRIAKLQGRKNPARVAAARFTYKKTLPQYRDYLRELPTTRQLSISGVAFLLVHGSPRKNNEPLYEDTPEPVMAELAAMTDADVIVCGHTHRPFIRPVARKLFINAGSAGRPAYEPEASYVLARCENGAIDAEIVKVTYPIEEVIAAIRRYGLPTELEDVFAKGQRLMDINEAQG